MNAKTTTVLTYLLTSFALSAMDLPQGFALDDRGVLHMGNATLSLRSASRDWRFHGNADWKEVKTVSEEDACTVSGMVTYPGQEYRVEERLQKTGEHQYRFDGAFHFAKPTGMNALFADINLPLPQGMILVDGKPLTIPERQGETAELLPRQTIQSLTVESLGGASFTVSGEISVMIQDNRFWGGNSVAVRIYVSTPPVEPQFWKDGEVSFTLDLRSPGAVPVALDECANRGLSDPDGSGWLGEGASADLNGVPAGVLKVAQFPFQIPESRKAIVTGRNLSQGAVSLNLPAGTRAGAVSLLHAADWPLLAGWQPEKEKPVGFIDVVYANGETESIPVKTDVDCGHWKSIGNAYPNAKPGYIGAADGVPVGLFASSFALTRDDPVSLTFRPAFPENTAWMIAAVTLSKQPVQFPATLKRGAFTLSENAQWKRLDFSRKTIPGSALDFSSFGLLDAPAGKYGALRVNDEGEFVFENAPEKRVRFYGVNLCASANFQSKEAVDELVDRLSRIGYNTIRLHHHDGWMIDPDAPDSITLDPEAMDKFDYLVAKCKEKGIYIATDLYVSRRFRPGDNLGVQDPETLKNVKGLLPVNEAAFENWKEFSRRWMTHRNPYTGLTWAEEPALAILGMVNEIFFETSWGKSPELVPIYREKYKEWLREKNISADSEGLFSTFLQELGTRMLAEMVRFVRDELKVKALLTGDCTFSPYQSPDWDYVDAHAYHAHPTFPERAWRLPQVYTTWASLQGTLNVPGGLIRRRIYGKPLTVTEINFCAPNAYRAESGPLIGTFAARQNWSGIWRFAWSHGAYLGGTRPVSTFDVYNDPLQQLSDRIAIALYLRGDLPAASRKITPWANLPEGSLSGEMRMLALQAQIGTRGTDTPLPADVQRYEPGMEIPDDGHVRYDAEAASLAVMTDRTETITLMGGSHSGRNFRVKNASGFMSLAVISRDGKPVPESNDLLLIHLTNILSTNARFESDGKIVSWGTLPLLVERGTATLELQTVSPWRVMALSADGAELGEVKAEFQDGSFRFVADTGSFPGGVIAYHLTR